MGLKRKCSTVLVRRRGGVAVKHGHGGVALLVAVLQSLVQGSTLLSSNTKNLKNGIFKFTLAG